MSAAAATRAIRDKAMQRTEAAIRGGLEAVADHLIIHSPIGDPLLWKRAPPPDYVPGRFVSNWNYAKGSVDKSTTLLTNIRIVNGLAEAEVMIGAVHYIANSVEYAQALEYGHSTQAPVGIMAVLEIEAPKLAERAIKEAAK